MLGRVLDVVFPRRCAGCADGAWPFCDPCRASLVPLEPPWCARCGRPWPLPVERCAECPAGPLRSVRAPFRYEGAARDAVRRLKFAGWRDVAAALGLAIATLDLPDIDVVTWVPLARRRRAERGYDQARALATAVGRELGVPVARLTRRTVRTAPQARRSAEERRQAMRNAFAPVMGSPARVLLVDDVLTTGATIAACAEALMAAGADQVHAATAARSFRGALQRSRRPAYPRAGPRSGLWLPGEAPR